VVRLRSMPDTAPAAGGIPTSTHPGPAERPREAEPSLPLRKEGGHSLFVVLSAQLLTREAPVCRQ
jgi:hypothetical protein